MMPLYAYAISNGEGTLIEYGSLDIDKLNMTVAIALHKRYTILIGPADGTGE